MTADVEIKHTTRQRQHAPHKEAGCVALISKHIISNLTFHMQENFECAGRRILFWASMKLMISR